MEAVFFGRRNVFLVETSEKYLEQNRFVQLPGIADKLSYIIYVQ